MVDGDLKIDYHIDQAQILVAILAYVPAPFRSPSQIIIGCDRPGWFTPWPVGLIGKIESILIIINQSNNPVQLFTKKKNPPQPP